MSRIFTSAFAAVAALGLATPALAQESMGAMANSNMPWCSSTVTDQCRQHQGRSGAVMHNGGMMRHGRMMHHGARHHHRMMHRMAKHHEMMKM